MVVRKGKKMVKGGEMKEVGRGWQWKKWGEKGENRMTGGGREGKGNGRITDLL